MGSGRTSRQPQADSDAGPFTTFGRGDEVALFERALVAPTRPFALLHVYGPPGIGKSHLLAHYARQCAGRARVITLERGVARDGDADWLDRALAGAVGVQGATGTWTRLADDPTPTAIFADDADPLGLLRAAGPRLPERCVLVVASRRPAKYESSESATFARHVCPVRLRDLDSEQASAMIDSHGVPASAQAAIRELAGGHPLALAIAASVAGRSASEAARVVTDALLALLRQETRHDEHRECLDIAAVAHVVREDLLCALGDPERGVAQFEWLRGLSFVEAVPDGLVLHEAFRRAICSDLRWRNPTRFASIVRRVRERSIERIWAAPSEQRDRAIEDFCLRGPEVATAAGALTVTGDSSTGDGPGTARAICSEHEGPGAARVLGEWSQRVPGSLQVSVDAKMTVRGLLLALPLGAARAHAETVADPGVLALLDATRAARTTAHDDRAVFVRSWMTRAHHQDPGPTSALLLAQIVKWQLGPAPLATTYVAFAQPSAFEGAIAAVGAEPVRNGAFRVDQTEHQVYRLDWRLVSPAICLAALADPRRVVTASATPGPMRRLDRSAFGSAVHDALRWYGDADALAASALLATHVVVATANGSAAQEDRVAALRALLLDAIAALSRTPKRAKLRRAVDRGYISGAATQQEAAELLDLPLSTYRRHLRSGVALVADFLWRRNLEVAGP